MALRSPLARFSPHCVKSTPQRTLLVAVLLVLLSTACTGADSSGVPEATTPTGSPGPATTETHPGVTLDAINLGFIYFSGAEEFAASIGIDAETGNTLGQIKAVVDAVNEGGGVAGRRVELFPFEMRTGEPNDSQIQAACAYFTQDNHVFAVSGNLDGVTGTKTDVLYECLADKGVILIESGGPGDTTAYQRYPGIAYAPSLLAADRAAGLLVQELHEAAWFDEESVVGIHSIASPIYDRVIQRVIIPKLAEYGHSVSESFELRLGPLGPENLGDYEAAVLRFKDAGVTHVINVGGAVPLFFALSAESQGWSPNWSVSSDQSPATWVAAMPAGQLGGVEGIGWNPALDVQPVERLTPANSAEARCAQIMQDAGENTALPLAWQFQLHACSAVFFIEAALQTAPTVSTSGFARGVSSLGETYVDPATFETRFVSGRHDGVGAYRRLAFDEECNCLRYTSELISVP